VVTNRHLSSEKKGATTQQGTTATGMRRVTVVLSTLRPPADRAGWSADHNFGRNQRTPKKEKGGLLSCHTPGVGMGRSQTGSRRSQESAH